MIESIKKWWTKPPALFPWAALFHLVITLHAIWTFRDEPMEGWAHPLSLVLYTVLWFMVCRMYRWAAWGYLGLTSINLMLHYLLAKEGALHFFSGSLFPIDILFSFFILVYYKKFE